MKKMSQGDKVQIHCYKHDGSLHRTCNDVIILNETEDLLICANDKSLITEIKTNNSKSYNKYKTKEPAILFFFKNSWFNIIVQMKKTGIFYYCNIASPYIIENGIIKYIDYDLDLRVYPDGYFKILDRNEYRYHRKKMQYSEDLDKIVQFELSNLINYKKSKTGAFDKKIVYFYYNLYQKILKKG